ncbi:MAG TPA: DUF503 domain-containing protein [Candidatus Limnocylindrales bacterium]|nr:DUF503 domain-containing protein [Candidatus Limnocylindrales bacterium]
MIIGICRVELYLPSNHSLKGKRQVLNSIKSRIKNRFNVSIAEIGHLETWQRSTIGIAMVSNDKNYVNQELNKVINHIEGSGIVSILDYGIELTSLNHGEL